MLDLVSNAINAKLFFATNKHFIFTFEVKCPPFSSAVSVETDASIAKQCCSVGYGVTRRIEEATRSYKLMQAAVDSLT